MTRLPKAVLLDMDDTILYDSGNVTHCWQEACIAYRSELGCVYPSTLYETVERIRNDFWADPERNRIGRLDLNAARQEIVGKALAEVGLDSPELVRKISARYASQRDLGVQPFDGAIPTVQWLRQRGCRLALLTNGARESQRSKVERFGLESLFDLILIEGELGYGKPDARVYELALQTLGATPDGTWMVGDNLECDVGGPQRLGIRGIWIDLHGAGLPSESGVRPDQIIRRLSELRDLEPGAEPTPPGNGATLPSTRA